MASVEELVHPGRLGQFVNQHVPGDDGPVEVEIHVAGYSNITAHVTRGQDRWVLRRPPAGPLLPTAHDVLREFRYISAMHGRARVPEPVIACEDPEVIGAPFYLMRKVEGHVIRNEVPAAFDTEEGRTRLASEMIDALVELHAVDWQGAGLSGRPDGYLERQLARWKGQWELTRPKTRDLPGLDEVTEWLERNVPEQAGTTVVHGDYKMDNVVFSPDGQRLEALLDWEMATIGDPLADLGWLMAYWGETGDPPPPAGEEIVQPAAPQQGGFPTREEMVAMYEERSGRPMREFTFYLVLAQYKLAIIIEGLYANYLSSTAANPASAAFEWQVPRQVDRARRSIAEGAR
jgi:aminoglycoside phosphotransferase (APT) family kinase protein